MKREEIRKYQRINTKAEDKDKNQMKYNFKNCRAKYVGRNEKNIKHKEIRKEKPTFKYQNNNLLKPGVEPNEIKDNIKKGYIHPINAAPNITRTNASNYTMRSLIISIF